MSDNNTREKIIETMYLLVAKKGYDKSSIGQIADIIGIKKASVYYYFKSKEDIFLQMVKTLYKTNYYDRAGLFKNEISAEAYFQELILMGEEFIDSYFKNKDLRKVFAEVDIQATRIPALKDFVMTNDSSFTHFLTKCMLHGVTSGALPKDFDTTLNAQILYTVIIGIDQAILYELPIEPKAVWKEVILKLLNRKAFL
ncbi:MAG: TetR/AcrR family transcriptional regulator [Hydrogenoanaerobacterium sp.]